MTLRQAIAASLRLLDVRGRRRLFLATLIQASLSLLDLAGVLLLGLVGALAVTSVQGESPPPLIEDALTGFGLSSLDSEQALAIFAGAAAALLLVKSLLSAVLLRRIFNFLAGQQAAVSSRLARDLLGKSMTLIQKRSSQETSFALIQGAGAATLQLLGQAVILVSEGALLLMLAIALLLVDPVVALVSIAFFGVVGLALQYALGSVAARAGHTTAATDVASLNVIQEVVSAYREVTVSNRRDHYVNRFQSLRWKASQAVASLQFVSALPKYVFEAALVVGAFALAFALLSTEDSTTAVGTLAVFLAAGTRIMPSILRIQGAALTARNASGAAALTLDLAQSLERDRPIGQPELRTMDPLDRTLQDSREFCPAVEVRNVSFTYPGTSSPALKGISLVLPASTTAALVGLSGAGKSTLADVILGVLVPDSGSVAISGVSPDLAIARWPGAIAYVPQQVTLANDTVRANVALGLPGPLIDDGCVWDSLHRARLKDVVRAAPGGLDAIVGEGGFRLSGGQRQRLGLARALYTQPRLLVLDEATSSLDVETELAIGETLRDLEGEVTSLVIAHRLSTVRTVDQVIYMENGECLATGTFWEVRQAVPAFDRQATAMGLRA